jgi:hypothetical protein
LSINLGGQRTVMSTPSSARMRAAYDVASSAVDILDQDVLYDLMRSVSDVDVDFKMLENIDAEYSVCGRNH